MTLDEALGELGVDREAGAPEVRKAYLRLLKTRKPDVDPEGFMRLRAAYELATEAMERGFAGVVTTVPPRVEEARAASAFEADSTSPPEPAGADEVVPREPEPVPLKLSLDEPKEVAPHFIAALDRARGADADRAPPSAFVMLTILKLIERGSLKTARGLVEAFDRWVASTGGARLLSPAAAAHYALVSELWRIRQGLPTELRAALAMALMRGDLSLVHPDFAAFRGSDRGEAERLAIRMRDEAPALHGVFGSVLAPRHAPDPPPRASRSGNFWWLPVVLGLSGVARLISSVSSPPQAAHYAQAELPAPVLSTMHGFASEQARSFSGRARAVHRSDLVDVAESLRLALTIGDCVGARDEMAALRALPADTTGSLVTPLVSLESAVDATCPGKGVTP